MGGGKEKSPPPTLTVGEKEKCLKKGREERGWSDEKTYLKNAGGRRGVSSLLEVWMQREEGKKGKGGGMETIFFPTDKKKGEKGGNDGNPHILNSFLFTRIMERNGKRGGGGGRKN